MLEDRRPNQLKLLFLSDGLAPFVTGGMQQHSVLLVKYLAPLVGHITLMHCGRTNGEVPNMKDVSDVIGNPKNVRIVGVSFVDRGRLPGHYLRASKRLSASYRNEAGYLEEYDAIYAQGLTGNAFLNKHPKVMVNLHGLEMFQPGFTLRERLAKSWIRPIFKKQIANSWRSVSLGGRLTDILYSQDVPKDRIAVIPNGIESSWLLGEAELLARAERRKGQSIRFVMVGRNEYRKGLHVLQEAMASLPNPMELHMIGDWPTWDNGIHNVVHHGVIRDKSELMALIDECDVLLLPSLSEGMPTVILEALARGLEVIASDVGACSELVDRRLLLPPADPERLSQAIAEQASACSRYPLDRFVFDEIARKTLIMLGD